MLDPNLVHSSLDPPNQPDSSNISAGQPLAPSSSAELPRCFCCSDQAIRGRVLAMLPGGVAMVDFGDFTEEVNVELIESAPGDIVLVHAKIAIARLGDTT